MKMLRLFAAVALAMIVPSLAFAQAAPAFSPGVNVQDTNPEPTKMMCWSGTVWAPCSGTAGLNTVTTPSALAANAVTPAATTAVASELILKASAGNLYSVNVAAGATAGFLLIFNATSAPADGAVTPVKCLPIAANAGVEMSVREMPEFFSTGIVAVFSSTGCFTKTASATAFISGDAK